MIEYMMIKSFSYKYVKWSLSAYMRHLFHILWTLDVNGVMLYNSINSIPYFPFVMKAILAGNVSAGLLRNHQSVVSYQWVTRFSGSQFTLKTLSPWLYTQPERPNLPSQINCHPQPSTPYPPSWHNIPFHFPCRVNAERVVFPAVPRLDKIRK